MDKISFVNKYITQCEEILRTQDGKAARQLEYDLIGIFKPDIPDITNTINSYRFSNVSDSSYFDDIHRLKGILENFRANILLEEKRAARELELARLKQPQMTQTTNVSVNVTIDQTIELINQIPPTVLCDEDKQDLIGDLCDMDKQKKLGNKEKAWEVVKKVLSFLADKGADAAIAALPLVMKALQG
ncbi:hypothetical protein SDC9_114523 [bioreactor metagenome]|uniref:Uncharacterized protein n=1 Tax=bioreactor metagenome TaxID=1076179 RepID=A0A645BQ96_9ZZZZ